MRLARSVVPGVVTFLVASLLVQRGVAFAAEAPAEGADRLDTAKMLVEYYRQMSEPHPFVVRKGEKFEQHRRQLKQKLLESTSLAPLPKRIPLDVHQSEPLDHPWCTVRRVYYRLWPDVYSSGLLFMPKKLPERPAPAMLCPHGHWRDGNAHTEVQRRCLNFARLGYVTFSSSQNHFEDLYVGVSHQTLMIWNNMRALDYLETLPEVDRKRIGVAGASGGGLQTEMLVALDPRVKAATIAGLTCDFREIMFPDRHHCVCNHFPSVMQYTDHPEISALGLPAAVQYLTMNDWTKNFRRDNFPTIQAVYTAAGLPDRVECNHFDTPHNYDKEKRERTYAWMARWVRGQKSSGPIEEPAEVKTFPIKTLKELTAKVPGDKGFDEIRKIYRRERGYTAPAISKPDQWRGYRRKMVAAIEELLGEDAALSRRVKGSVSTGKVGDLFVERVVERVHFPSEGNIRVPAILVRPRHASDKLPVAVILSGTGRQSLLEQKGPDSATSLAIKGSLVVLADLRCFGQLLSTGTKNLDKQRKAWERNGIVWGRPVPGMASTDLRAVLDGLAARSDADMQRVKVIARDSPGLAISVLFAAALDARIASVDIDLGNRCFAERNLPLVPFVLQHGDVLQWAALLADRRLTIRNIPPEAGDPAWLAAVFAAIGNAEGLEIKK